METLTCYFIQTKDIIFKNLPFSFSGNICNLKNDLLVVLGIFLLK